ncbi:MAG: TetR family transcriptional regulator C-terminal domain-containing protein [Saprospiraceae bacterium]
MRRLSITINRINTKVAESFLAAAPSVKAGFLNLFKIIIEQSVKDSDKKGCFVVNTTTELIPNDEKWLPVLDRNRKNFEAIFLKHLKRGVAQGEIKSNKDLKSIAALIYALNNGLQVVAKINPSKKDLMKIVEAGLGVLD